MTKTEGPDDLSGQEPGKIDRQKLDAEIEELTRYIQWAQSIGVDTKTRALLKALEIGFSEMERIGAARRAVVFTESRRTQQFLRDFLEANGHAGRVVVFNGTNSDTESTRIYEQWLEANKDNGRASDSRAIDVRTALIEYFQNHGDVLLATEAGAEGINLQFCSLVINYDLPWNPQRIEQRIGRCHRYGQKHDVVVINFLNAENEADLRVHELLEEKFNLFTGLFGASDEVLGSIESGVDFERRVLDIYQQCRTREEIDAAFETLRKELDESITSRMQQTRRLLLEHFDEDVHARLRVNLTGAKEQLDRVAHMFWVLTRFILDGKAQFDDEAFAFHLADSPLPSVHPGLYHMISKVRENFPGEFLYRLGHPLGEYVIQAGKSYTTPAAKVAFNISNHPARITVVEALKGKSGWLILQRLGIDSFEREDHLLFSAFDDDGKALTRRRATSCSTARGRFSTCLTCRRANGNGWRSMRSGMHGPRSISPLSATVGISAKSANNWRDGLRTWCWPPRGNCTTRRNRSRPSIARPAKPRPSRSSTSYRRGSRTWRIRNAANVSGSSTSRMRSWASGTGSLMPWSGGCNRRLIPKYCSRSDGP